MGAAGALGAGVGFRLGTPIDEPGTGGGRLAGGVGTKGGTLPWPGIGKVTVLGDGWPGGIGSVGGVTGGVGLLGGGLLGGATGGVGLLGGVTGGAVGLLGGVTGGVVMASWHITSPLLGASGGMPNCANA